jgi:hypothetical protein
VNFVVGQLRRNGGLGNVRAQLDSIGLLEEQSRKEWTNFLSGLFRDSSDPLVIMKKRELHELLTDAIVACDEVGRTIEQVLLKND